MIFQVLAYILALFSFVAVFVAFYFMARDLKRKAGVLRYRDLFKCKRYFYVSYLFEKNSFGVRMFETNGQDFSPVTVQKAVKEETGLCIVLLNVVEITKSQYDMFNTKWETPKEKVKLGEAVDVVYYSMERKGFAKEKNNGK